MKCLYLLLVVTLTQGSPVEKEKIPAPSLISLTAVDPPGFEVEWKPVHISDASDPIVGYKVRVWERHGKVVMKYKEVDGKRVLVEEIEPPKFGELHANFRQDENMQTYTTENTKIMIPNIKLNVFYETRVQACTKDREGPLSEPMSIKLQKDDGKAKMRMLNDHDKDVYKTV